MAEYTPYAEYKPTNADWLRDVPGHWKVIQIKHLTPVKRGASPRPIDDPRYFDDEGKFAWVRIADVSASERYLDVTTQRLSEIGEKLSVKMLPGDLFLSIAGTVGKPIITKIKCCIHDGFVYFPDFKENKEFLYYVFACGQPYLGLGKMGTQLNLNTDTVGSISIGLPPSDEQASIVRFLDYKTAQIDALIAKKQALLTKLAEKRTALISHAVTKGLDPSVPMKDSGVEWLAKIPTHWQRMLLARVISRFEQGWSPACDEREASLDEWGVLKSGCVNYGIFQEREHKTLPTSIDPIESLEVKAGDVLMCRASGSKHLIGSVAKVNNCRRWLIFSDKTYRISFHKKLIDSDFFVLTMKSKYMRDQIELSISGADGLANNIPQSSVKAYQLVLPSIREQKTIVESLRDELKHVTAQEEKISAVITRLREYRSALITNTVTGKIDVRNFNMQRSANMETVNV